MNDQLKIEFGCGEKPTKENFKTCDIRNVPGIDFVCPAWEIDLHVKKNSVDEIFSRHFFEHLTFQQGKKVLEIWYKILKPNGRMEMMLPNMDFHIHQWVSRSDLEHAKAGFWGIQRGKFDDVWDVHKSGYNFETLSNLLESVNFKNIKSMNRNKGKHLHVECFKI